MQKYFLSHLKCGQNRSINLEHGPVIMGILNVTPDSFSDGGQWNYLDSAMKRVQEMENEGVHLIDIGAESTRPNAIAVDADEELSRLKPVLEMILRHSKVPISIDTYKPKVAMQALKMGAHIINDIWGLQGSGDMARVVSEYGAGVVIMHNRHEIDADLDIVEDMKRFFERSLEIAEKAGISKEFIALDPGIGFGKTLEQNIAAICSLSQLHQYCCPLLLGVSRKSYIHALSPAPVEQRLGGTLATQLFGLEQGCSIYRVHDVFEALQAFKVYGILHANSSRVL